MAESTQEPFKYVVTNFMINTKTKIYFWNSEKHNKIKNW